MFDGSLEVTDDRGPTWDVPRARLDWRTVDRELRSIAKQRCALDASEARWLREAEKLQIWKHLGMVSSLDYLERVLGYTPHAARERLRVANALGELPAIGEAFALGELPFSAVRELTRVATANTDAEWRDAAIGKSVHEIEQAVAGRTRGSLPDDPPDPAVRTQVVRFELRPDTYARLRQARAALADEHGRHLDDDELVAVLCDAALGRAEAATDAHGRARYQIAMTVCERCHQGWQHGAGAELPVDAASVDQALCDAQHIGSIDGDRPARAHQDVPPATVRLVWRRDGGRCQTEGCRSTRNLEIHHIVHREDGGSHEPSNLTIRCGACHRAHHAGRLTITGTAPDRIVTRRRDERESQPTSRLEDEILRVQAREALVGLGWKAALARAAVEAAASHVGPGATIDAWVRGALRRCPVPRTG
ncbi:MAG TPA: HNH endonuclease [Kofleriaceae bacterium]|nr:HNH endonuclease [Kofleriaceae bacterium]